MIAGLRDLRDGRGDTRALHGDLAGWYRLRVGKFRIIYKESPGQICDCVFAERRSVVYAIFSKLRANNLLDR